MNTSKFTYSMPTKIIFGNGSLSSLETESNMLGKNILIICGKRSAIKNGVIDKIVSLVNKASVHVFNEVTPDPDFNLIIKANKVVSNKKISGIIAVGGGSVIDAAKLIAASSKNPLVNLENYTQGGKIVSCYWDEKNNGLPVIAIPTTSGTGSEVTKASVISDQKNKVKCSIKSPDFFPKVAIIDPLLTLSLPPFQTAATGLDALVHGLESYISKSANPITDALAMEAIELIYKYLPKSLKDPGNAEFREKLSLGSMMAGITETNAGLGVVHVLAHPIGIRFNVAHGVACAVTLVSSLDFNSHACNEKINQIGERLLGKKNAILAIKKIDDFIKSLPIPKSLKDLGIQESDLDTLSEEGFANSASLSFNPREVSSKKQLYDILLKSLN